jgi:hypothetical protein
MDSVLLSLHVDSAVFVTMLGSALYIAEDLQRGWYNVLIHTPGCNGSALASSLLFCE